MKKLRNANAQTCCTIRSIKSFLFSCSSIRSSFRLFVCFSLCSTMTAGKVIASSVSAACGRFQKLLGEVGIGSISSAPWPFENRMILGWLNATKLTTTCIYPLVIFSCHVWLPEGIDVTLLSHAHLSEQSSAWYSARPRDTAAAGINDPYGYCWSSCKESFCSLKS